MIEALGQVIQSIAWVLGFVEFSVLDGLWNLIQLGLPPETDWHQPYATFVEWVNVADAWIPMRLAYTLGVAYLKFWSLTSSIKLALRFIPWI